MCVCAVMCDLVSVHPREKERKKRKTYPICHMEKIRICFVCLYHFAWVVMF